MTDRDEIRVRKALQGMDFPADRTAVVRFATNRGEDDPTVLRDLEALPDRTFSNVDDAVISVPQRPEYA